MSSKSQPRQQPLEAADQAIDIRAILHVLIEKAWLIVLCLLVGVFAGLAYIARAPKIYRSQAVLQIDPDESKERVLGLDEKSSDDLTKDEMMQTIVDGFYTRTLWQKVVEANALQKNPDYLPPKPDKTPYTVDEATDAMGGFVKAERRKGTMLVDAAVEHPDPKMAQLIANSLAHEYIRLKITQGVGNSDLAVEYLMDEAKKVKAHLQKSEEALQNYKETNNSVSLEQKQDTVISKLRSQTNLYSNAKADRIRLEADCKTVENLAGQPEAILNVASVSKHPIIRDLKKQIADAQNVISGLGVRYTDKHPKMIESRTKLAQLQDALLQNAANMPRLIRSDYEAALATEQNFEAALHDQEKMALELNRQSIGFNTLARDLETDRALYEALITRIKQTDVAKGIELTYLRMFESANLLTDPVKPKKPFVLAMSIVGGLLTGIAVSFGLNAMDNSLKTVDQAEAVTGLPVLAAIPRGTKSEFGKRGLVTLKKPGSAVAEAFRSLRTSLHLAAKKSGSGAIVFTGAMPSEGKSFCAMNYSITLAQQGLRTLLIDCDLRRPMVGRTLLNDHDKLLGLVDCLEDTCSPSMAIHTTEIDNLSVMPSGSSVSRPAELLSKPEFGIILKQMASQFDQVVIDSAPVNAVSDTLLILEHVPYVCIVAQAGKTSSRMILRACRTLVDAAATPVGIVLNQVPENSGMDAFYHYTVVKYGNEVYGESERAVSRSA